MCHVLYQLWQLVLVWRICFHNFFSLKGIVHPKMKILSSFTHPQLVPNLYECLCSAEHKGRYSEECGKQSSSGAPLTSIVFFFPTMEVNGAPKQPGYKLSSKYLPLCSAEQRNSYRFGTTWGWVNDDRIFIFGWTIPLSSLLVPSLFSGRRLWVVSRVLSVCYPRVLLLIAGAESALWLIAMLWATPVNNTAPTPWWKSNWGHLH